MGKRTVNASTISPLMRKYAWLGLAAALSCSTKDQGPRGQLMLAIQTDMSLPDDMDSFRIQVRLRDELRHDRLYQVAPDGDTTLPATLAIVAGQEQSPPVEITVIGFQRGVARTFSKVVTTVPRDRIATVRIPIQWLCLDMAEELEPGAYGSKCGTVDEVEAACVSGDCKDVHVEERQLETFVAETIFGGASQPDGQGAQCFDTTTCFANSSSVTPEEDCSFELTLPEDAEPNVALLLTEGAGGICTGESCYVPLDFGRLGFQTEELPAAEGEEKQLRVNLPRAVCGKLDEGSVKEVRVSLTCQTKTEELPTCGPWWSNATPAPPPSDTGSSGGGGVAGEAGAETAPSAGGMPAGGSPVVSAGTGGSGACAEGQTLCESGCTSLETDSQNCGECNKACPVGSTCASGQCACQGDLSPCGDACVDTSSDIDHCGACNSSCSDGASCDQGSCVCPEDQDDCNGSCVDTQSDSNNCSGCGVACPDNQVCSEGSCTDTCSGNLTPCGQSCVDITLSTAHCGGCGNACEGNQSCIGGSCGCPAGQTSCDGQCLDTNTNNSHCGGCNNACSGGRTCNAGACACSAGLTFCDTSCVDTQTNGSHCGGCNSPCGANQACNGGTCVCQNGLRMCTGQCVDTDTDSSNCGDCGVPCATGCVGGNCAPGGSGGTGAVGGAGGVGGQSPGGYGGVGM